MFKKMAENRLSFEEKNSNKKKRVVDDPCIWNYTWYEGFMNQWESSFNSLQFDTKIANPSHFDKIMAAFDSPLRVN